MSLRIVVDMNLSVEWVPVFVQAGQACVHWASVGDPHAPDGAIMAWARLHRHVVFTRDLDFGTTLALTHAEGPSVVQLRGPRVLPEHAGPLILAALARFEAPLLEGALVVVDQTKRRIRILPL